MITSTGEFLIQALRNSKWRNTPVIENKKLSKDKTLYLRKPTFKDTSGTFVSCGKIEGRKTGFGKIFNYELIKSFTCYLDCLNGKTQQILYINSRHAPGSEYERVFTHADVYAPKSDFELLKMGGMSVPVKWLRTFVSR